MSCTVACIGGAAAYNLLDEGAFVAQRLGAQPTPFGRSQPIYRCRTRFGEFFFLLRHGESRYELAPGSINYRANIYALKDLGMRTVVSWSETRAISHNYKIGEYVVVGDLIDETRARPATFFENRGLGDVRQWPVFCPSLRQALVQTLEAEGCRFARDGVYVCTEGPRRETPAEARKYLSYGGDLIGHTLAPEVFLAKELEMCYACLSYIASYVEHGCDFRPFEHGRVLAAETEQRRAAAAVERFPRLLERLSHVLPNTPAMCKCDTTMRKHVDAGQIGPEWRGWFELERSPEPAPPAPVASLRYVPPARWSSLR